MGIKEDRENFIKRTTDFLKSKIQGDDIFWANEIAANFFVTIVMWMLIAVELITIVLSMAGVFHFSMGEIGLPLGFTMAQMLAAITACNALKGSKPWIKYMLIFVVCVTIAAVYSLLGFRVSLILTLPVILSTRYMDVKLTKTIAWISGFFLLTSSVSYAFLGVSLDLDLAPLAPGTVITVTNDLAEAVTEQAAIDTAAYVQNILTQHYLPNILQFFIVAEICISIAKWGHATVISQSKVSQAVARLDTELTLATDIQANMLPNIYPAIPEHDQFELFATMNPAKEVGGDFYDYFMIDKNKLCVVMADVSGKGVPAALFMVIAKTLIKNYAQLDMPPAKVFDKVNNILLEGNSAQLFVTAWMGVLDTATGELTYVNAGHTHPVLKSHGKYMMIKDRPDFVLAGMEDYTYNQHSFRMHDGDSLFLYTDGVTEATSRTQELYGEERMIDYLNSHADSSLMDRLHGFKAEVDAFQDEQADDITMLLLDIVKLHAE